MKNEELINLQGGGYGSGNSAWVCYYSDGTWEYDCKATWQAAEFFATGCNLAGEIGRWCSTSCSEASWYSSLCP